MRTPFLLGGSNSVCTRLTQKTKAFYTFIKTIFNVMSKGLMKYASQALGAMLIANL